MKKIVLLPHIKILNANALSSPYSVGFPAMTSWLGASHALQRRLNSQSYHKWFKSVEFLSTAVICHHIELQTYRHEEGFVSSIVGTSNPLIPKAERGKPKGNAVRPSFIEEARCHLEVSVVMEVELEVNYEFEHEMNGLSQPETEIPLSDPFIENELTRFIDHELLSGLKMAAGDILSAQPSQLLLIADRKDYQGLIRQLMPGFCLIERRDLMQSEMQQGKDAIDALLNILKTTHRCENDENGEPIWLKSRHSKGWIVPIATGFHAITPLADAENQRDQNTPHRFAESLVTLGEFVMPYRLESLDQMLWHHQTDLENNLYFCQQKQNDDICLGEGEF